MLIMLFLIVIMGVVAVAFILTISKTISRIEHLTGSIVEPVKNNGNGPGISVQNAVEISSESTESLFQNGVAQNKLNKPELLALYDQMPSMLKSIDENTQLIDASGFSYNVPCQVVNKEGEVTDLLLSATGVKDGSGEFINTNVVLTNVTEKRRVEDERNFTQNMLVESSKMANVGGWEVDLKTQNVYWSSVSKEIYEVHSDFIPDVKSALGFCKEGTCRNSLSNALSEAIESGVSWDLELRIITAKNSEKWLNSKGRVRREKGKVVGVYGTFQDISDRKSAEKRLKRSEMDLKKAERLARIGNWWVDTADMKFTCSDEYLNIYEISSPEEMTNEYMQKCVHPDDLTTFNDYLNQIFTTSQNESYVYRIILNGEMKYIDSFVEQHFNEKNEVVKLFGTVQDVTKRQTLELKLQKKNLYLNVLSQTEKEFLKADSKWYLANQFCRILAEEMSYSFVQIKLPSKEKGGLISPIGACAKDKELLKEVSKWSNSKKIKFPDQDAFVSKEILLLKDVSDIKGHGLWKQNAKASNFKSFLSIPFFYSDEAKGVFSVYLKEEWSGDEEELDLLSQVANDFAFGLHSLKINEEKTKLSNFNTMLASSLNIVSASMNLVNNTIRFNGECKYVLGYTIKEMGPNLGEFKHKIHPNDLTAFQQKLESIKEPQFDIEYRYRQPSGNYRWLNTIGHMHYNENNEAVKMTAIIINIDSKKNEESNQMKAEIKGKDLERKRIAEEIHDSLGQTLTVASMSLDSIKQDVQFLEGGKQSIFSNAQALVNQAITETREISHNLMPATLQDFGLIPSLTADIKKLNKTGDIQFTLYHYYVPDRFDPEIEINIYKIIKEAINNILKHSKAKTASVQLFVQNDFLTVMIEDDGVGFSKSRSNHGEGIGLRNLKNRVESIGGEIIIERTKGVLISIEVQI